MRKLIEKVSNAQHQRFIGDIRIQAADNAGSAASASRELGEIADSVYKMTSDMEKLLRSKKDSARHQAVMKKIEQELSRANHVIERLESARRQMSLDLDALWG